MESFFNRLKKVGNPRSKLGSSEFVQKKTLHRKEVLLANYIARHLYELHVEDNDKKISLSSDTYLTTQCSFRPVFSFLISVCGTDIVVLVDRGFIDFALDHSCRYEVFSKLPLELKMAVISPLADLFVKSIPAIKDKDVTVRTRTSPSLQNNNYDVYWELAARKNDLPAGRISLCSKYARVDELLENIHMVVHPNRDLMSRMDLPVFGQLYIGSLSLKRRDVCTLSVGDVLISESDIKGERASLSFSESLSFSCSVNNMKLKINGLGDSAMRTLDSGSSDVVEDVNVDDIDLKLTLDIGHICIPLCEIVSLKPGCVLEMPDSYEKRVNIRNHDRLVATGELVQVGENLGVEIREIRYGIN